MIVSFSINSFRASQVSKFRCVVFFSTPQHQDGLGGLTSSRAIASGTSLVAITIGATSHWPSRLAYAAAGIFCLASGGTNLIYGWSKGGDLPTSTDPLLY
jgi:hypothetical protein